MNNPDDPGMGKRGAEGRIGYLLRQAQTAVRITLDRRLANAGLSLPQFSILTLIRAYDAPSGAMLARLSLLTPQTVHGVLKTLEGRGLIARTPHPAHGRALALALTTQGANLLTAATKIARTVEEEMLEGLAANDERVIRDWLAGLAGRFA
jgi:DNA-binding MarR family transcriptional regulator